VTWFHFSKEFKLKVVIDGHNNKIARGAAKVQLQDIEDAKGTFLIVDGVTKESYTDVSAACASWFSQKDERQYCKVSSASVVVAWEQQKEAELKEFTVGSWHFEELEAACADQTFFAKVKTNLVCPGDEKESTCAPLLLHKYQFAGGCARWMFEFSYNEWQVDFNKHLGKVPSYAEVLGEAGGDASADAVNHLRGVTVIRGEDEYPETKYFFVSKHAAEQLSLKCSDKHKFFVESYAKAAATKNPAYRGWIFEFDVDYQLQTACVGKKKLQLKFHREAGLADVAVKVSKYEKFGSNERLFELIQDIEDEQVLWVQPELWCQKAFDFLYFYKLQNGDLAMVTVNATFAKTHSVLLDVVHTLAKKVEEKVAVIGTIRFDFLVPTGGEFRVASKVRGQLCEWNSLPGVKWLNSTESNALTDAGCIVVCELEPTTK
jgi:hypothetical protein